jgi:flagellar protein FliO/FliZ
MAVALAATVLTPQVSAQQKPPADTSPTEADHATPLALRPSRALEMAPETSHGSLGWKVVAVLVILGGAAFYLRKRVQPKRIEDGQLTIVRRAALGMRSELVIVDVEGQRLLLGVTPHSIQSLAVLDIEAPANPAGSDLLSAPARGGQDLAAVTQAPTLAEERFAAMLRAADLQGPTHRLHAEARAPADEPSIAGQAKGLLALRRRG